MKGPELAAKPDFPGWPGILEEGKIDYSEKIRRGNSVIRNPILVSYVAKGLLPYHGLGSGIKRALGSGRKSTL